MMQSDGLAGDIPHVLGKWKILQGEHDLALSLWREASERYEREERRVMACRVMIEQALYLAEKEANILCENDWLENEKKIRRWAQEDEKLQTYADIACALRKGHPGTDLTRDFTRSWFQWAASALPAAASAVTAAPPVF